MEVLIVDIEIKILCKVKEYALMLMEENTKVDFEMTNMKDLEKFLLLMDWNFKVFETMEKHMDKESLLLLVKE